MKNKEHLQLIIAIILMMIVVHSSGIAQGTKKCAYCEMIYQFPKFGGEIITMKNDTLWYDASECLASVVARDFLHQKEIRILRSVNYLAPKEWIDNRTAYFLHSDNIPSPMSMNISAYKSKADALRQQKIHGGEVMRWKEVVELVNKRWFKK